MVSKRMIAKYVSVFVLGAAVASGISYFAGTSESTTVSVSMPVEEQVSDSGISGPVSEVVSETPTLFAYDSASQVRSFEPWMIFVENYSASYHDSTFLGNYQLVYPREYPGGIPGVHRNGKFDRLLLSKLFGKDAPKNVNRKSIQAALNKMMKSDIRMTHESRAEDGEYDACLCNGYFHAMPTERSQNWISFQQISQYICGGNAGPVEEYYTIITPDGDYEKDSAAAPYIMDTTAFVPNFRGKMVDIVTDNVIYNFYKPEYAKEIGRNKIRTAVADQFKENFQLSLTYSGVKFLFDVWALPRTSHADGRISIIVPYNMIQEIFTEKFKKDIGL